jgi:hypothetical protein
VKRPRDGKSRNFLSLLQDSSINDRYSVARGVTKQNRYWDKWLTNETYLSAKELRVFVGSLHLVYDVLELAYLFTQNQHNVLLMQGISWVARVVTTASLCVKQLVGKNMTSKIV